jgi:Raf kinase inhibitor-like YbhB/YbcL family protein
MKRIALAVMLLGCKDSPISPTPPPGQTAAQVTVTSSTFSDGAGIPVDDTCDGADQSPQLTWTAMPDKTKTVALVVDDPDAPSGTFTHWILWNVSGGTRVLGAGGNGGYAGGISGMNDFGKLGYGGPCPPKGQLHHYHFRVYGLDTTLTLKPTDKRADLDRAMTGHVIAQGELVGTFKH